MQRNNFRTRRQAHNPGQNKKLRWRKRTQARHQQQEEISTQRQDSSAISSAPRCMNTPQSPSRGTETSQETCSLPNSDNKSLTSSSFSLNPLAQEFQPSLSVFPPQRMMPVVGAQPQPVVSQHRLRTIAPSKLESLMKQARSILNKITSENFDRSVTRFLEFVEEKVTCYEHLEVVLDAIVLVAVDQSACVELYVELLSKMCQRKEMVESWEWVRARQLDSEKIVKSIVTDLCRKRHEQYWYTCNASRQSEFLSDFLESPKEVSDLITQFCTNDDIECKMKNRLFGVYVLMGEMCKKKRVSKIESANLDKRTDLREDCWGRPQIVRRQRPLHRRDVSRGYRGRFSAHQDSYRRNRRNSRLRYFGRY